MGIWAETAKTNKYNLSLLRKKSFFKDIAEPRAIRRTSIIDPQILKRKSKILLIKHRRRNILSTFIIYPISMLAFALMIWIFFF